MPSGYNGGSLTHGVLSFNLSGDHVTDSQTVQDVLTYNVTSVTPEPSSLVLLGTGLAATVGTMRRRIRGARA